MVSLIDHSLLTRKCFKLMQLPYGVIEVNPLTKSELKWSEYKKVRKYLLLP